MLAAVCMQRQALTHTTDGRFAANTQHRNYFELNLNRPATAATATATGGSKKLAASFS
jgi:hypothetical protein